MMKRFWSWLKAICQRPGKTDYDLKDWHRLEFRRERERSRKESA